MAITKLLLIVLFVVAVSASPLSPVGNKKPTFYTYSNISTGETRKCGVVECRKNFHVVPCKSKDEMDTCRPCLPGTHLLDPTNSYMEIYECQKIINCTYFEHVIPSTINHSCKHNIQVLCQCDTKAGFCGDPCNCKEKNCEPGETLHSNCTCGKIKTTSIPTTTEAAKMAMSTTSQTTLTSDHYFRKTTLILTTTEATKTAISTTSPTTLLTDNGLTGGDIAGIVIGSLVSIVFVIIVTALVVIFCVDEEKQNKIRSRIKEKNCSSGYSQPSHQNSS